MAKLSFDYAQLTSHPRFKALVRKMGGDPGRALDCVCRFWNSALVKWGDGRQLLPLDDFEVDEDFAPLVECRFAELRPDGVYAKGAKDNFDWLAGYRDHDHQSKAGRASAESRREKTGTAQPHGGKGSHDIRTEIRTGTEQEPNATERQPNRNRTGSNASTSISSTASDSQNSKCVVDTARPRVDPQPSAHPPTGKMTYLGLCVAWRESRPAGAEESDRTGVGHCTSAAAVAAAYALDRNADPDYWRKAVAAFAASDFINGRKPGRDGTPFWCQNPFVWMVDHADELVAGKYRNRPPRKKRAGFADVPDRPVDPNTPTGFERPDPGDGTRTSPERVDPQIAGDLS